MKTEYRVGNTVMTRAEYWKNQIGIWVGGVLFELILFLVWYFNG